MMLATIAQENLAIYERGEYMTPHGVRVRLAEAIHHAVSCSVLYPPDQLAAMKGPWPPSGVSAPRIHVSAETTAQAARRLVEQEGHSRVVALNFASAKKPGGGFLSGAKAQEEDLARCSALYPCLAGKQGYYEANRAQASSLYTDHMIYSPDVPFFRDEQLALLERFWPLSIITAPAPNAGEVLRREPAATAQIRATLERRAGMILAIAATYGHRSLVLGAWGCGVFRNRPQEVAEIFSRWLAHPRFAGVFSEVIFAIYDRSRERRTWHAFVDRFGKPEQDDDV